MVVTRPRQATTLRLVTQMLVQGPLGRGFYCVHAEEWTDDASPLVLVENFATFLRLGDYPLDPALGAACFIYRGDPTLGRATQPWFQAQPNPKYAMPDLDWDGLKNALTLCPVDGLVLPDGPALEAGIASGAIQVRHDIYTQQLSARSWWPRHLRHYPALQPYLDLINRLQAGVMQDQFGLTRIQWRVVGLEGWGEQP